MSQFGQELPAANVRILAIRHPLLVALNQGYKF
jgi:hypothetical protein